MKPHFLIAAALVAASPVLANDKHFDIAGFDEIKSNSGVSVDVVFGDRYSVVAEAKSGNIKRLEIYKRGDTLHISRKKRFGMFRKDRFAVTVTLPELSSVKASSGSTMSVDGGQGANLWATASSGATLRIENAVYDRVEAASSSGATLTMSGSCTDLEAEASSGGTMDAGMMTCVRVDVDSRSGSSLTTNGSETANIEVSSGAVVRLTGGAKIDQIETSSGGSVKTF